jgi:hypothetical protein
MAMSRTAVPSLHNLTSEPRHSIAPPGLARTVSAFALPERVTFTPFPSCFSLFPLSLTLTQHHPYFGVSLGVLMDQQLQAGDECKIPSVIDKALSCLEEKGREWRG